MDEPTPFLHKPRSPLPPVVMVSEPDSFAQYTIRERLPAILQRVITENTFSSAAVANLDTLARELPDRAIRPIRDDGGPDVTAWSTYIAPFASSSWLNLPFYLAEAYFYRRILEAIEYFQSDPTQRPDPFAVQKCLSLETALEAIRAIALSRQPESEDCIRSNGHPATFVRLLYLALWGNRVDLSLWSASESSRIRTDVDQDEQNILVNHSYLLAEYLSQLPNGRVDFILDNAGFELVCDLLLVDFLLSTQIARTVHCYLKPYPMFVSDATLPDVHHTLRVLTQDSQSAVRSLAVRLQSYLSTGQLSFQNDLFWAAPLPFWEMPSVLRQELASSQLVFIKGDANYRRLLGDCHWAFTTPLNDIAGYFPSPLVALRTLKSEVVAGLPPQRVEGLTTEDPEWLISGRWGVIQLVDPYPNKQATFRT